MEIIIRPYTELSKDELFEILKTRMSVFVVEQECPYQDIDDKDKESVHIYLKDENILAYLRLFQRDEETVQMGRVMTTVRNKGYGRQILQAGIEAAGRIFQAKQIYIEAQVYALDFYAKEGFMVCGEEFVEDGIPHIAMLKQF